LAPVLLPLAAAAAIAAGWRLGVIIDRWGGEPSSLESGIAAPSHVDRSGPPRISSNRFDALCPQAAPVLVYDDDSTPSAFVVQLAGAAADANQTADSLARLYALAVEAYDDDRRALAIHGAAPATVSQLRCEPGVRALEERPVSR
jgi:hypothetical protein